MSQAPRNHARRAPAAPAAWARSVARGKGKTRPLDLRRTGSAIFSDQAWDKIGVSLALSRRELQITRGVFDDRTEEGIASSLGISCHTVHTHVQRLHRKAGVADRVGLLLRVMCEFLNLTTALGSGLPPICARRSAGRCPFRD